MKFSVFQVSRKGGRDENEDRMGYCYTRESLLFLLADGMGGHPEGEIAAQLALQTIASLFQKQARPKLDDASVFLNDALLAAQHQILRYAARRGMLDSPRTTIVAAVVQSGRVTWTHCGDSRLYFVRRAGLLTRTKDHSLIERHLAKSPLAVEADFPNRNALYTCLGSPIKPIFAVTGPQSLQQGDCIMLCSDGLWSTVPEQEIIDELDQKPLDVAVPELVEKALRLGGESCDNVTCIAMAWETPDAVESAEGNISTESIDDGGFASTMQVDGLDDEMEDLDDAAIERSIAEINAAIRRTANKKI